VGVAAATAATMTATDLSRGRVCDHAISLHGDKNVSVLSFRQAEHPLSVLPDEQNGRELCGHGTRSFLCKRSQTH
jgi:hypothetical protein